MDHFILHNLQCLEAILGFEHDVTFIKKIDFDQLRNFVIIIYDQYVSFHTLHPLSLICA
ncbi:hypothetical protein D3C81_1408990 [compost metagenome]